MAIIAKRFVLAGAATAQARGLDAGNHTPGAAGDFEIAADLQRSVKLRVNR